MRLAAALPKDEPVEDGILPSFRGLSQRLSLLHKPLHALPVTAEGKLEILAGARFKFCPLLTHWLPRDPSQKNEISLRLGLHVQLSRIVKG
jgi:hypothetical protein